VIKIIFADNRGNILMPDQVDELSEWEIEERGIHVEFEEWP
jgi:hypothetical protein